MPLRFGASGSLRVTTRRYGASAAPVMNCFDPLMTNSSPSRRARVRTEAASEPAPGSVSAKAKMASPVTIFGR